MGKVGMLGQIIRARREELGLSQEELAERVGDGITQSGISGLERGKVTLPRRQRMEHIAVALRLPLGELLARSGWNEAEAHVSSAPEPAMPDMEAQRAWVASLLPVLPPHRLRALVTVLEAMGYRFGDMLDLMDVRRDDRQ